MPHYPSCTIGLRIRKEAACVFFFSFSSVFFCFCFALSCSCFFFLFSWVLALVCSFLPYVLVLVLVYCLVLFFCVPGCLGFLVRRGRVFPHAHSTRLDRIVSRWQTAVCMIGVSGQGRQLYTKDHIEGTRRQKENTIPHSLPKRSEHKTYSGGGGVSVQCAV